MVIKREDPGRFTKGNSTKSIGITNKSIHFSVYILDGKKLLDGFSYLAKRLRKHKNWEQISPLPRLKQIIYWIRKLKLKGAIYRQVHYSKRQEFSLNLLLLSIEHTMESHNSQNCYCKKYQLFKEYFLVCIKYALGPNRLSFNFTLPRLLWAEKMDLFFGLTVERKAHGFKLNFI